MVDVGFCLFRALIPLSDEVGRRPVWRYKCFTVEENKAIEDGYKKYGPNWSLITQEYSVELAERSEVDIKDRHRNMTGTAATADLVSDWDSFCLSFVDWLTCMGFFLQTTPLRVIFHHEASLVELITTNFPRVEKYLDVVTSIVRSKVKRTRIYVFACSWEIIYLVLPGKAFERKLVCFMWKNRGLSFCLWGYRFVGKL